MYADHDEQEGRRQWNQANPAGGRVAPPAPRLGQIPQIQRGVPLPLPRPVPVPAPHPPAAAAPVAIDDDDEDDDIVVVSSDGEGEPPPAKRPKVQHGDQVGATGGVYGEDDYGYADPGMDYGYYEVCLCTVCCIPCARMHEPGRTFTPVLNLSENSTARSFYTGPSPRYWGLMDTSTSHIHQLHKWVDRECNVGEATVM